jgi:hypothetical protein
VNIASEYFVLAALRKSFSAIANRPNIKKVTGTYYAPSDDWDEHTLELTGIAKIHGAKISDIVFNMLEEFALIHGKADDGSFYVNEYAADLIVSFLAQRMARRIPMRTITDIESSFLLSTACDVIENSELDRNAILASLVLKIHIPTKIGDLAISEFAEIRKRYEPLRELFPTYLRDLSDTYQLTQIQDTRTFIARLEDIAGSIVREIENIKKADTGYALGRWLPLGLGSLVSIGAAVVSDDPILKYVAAGAAIAIQALSLAMDGAPMSRRFAGAQSLMLAAKRDIINAERLANFANPAIPYY